MAIKNIKNNSLLDSLLKEANALKEGSVVEVPKKPTWDRQAFWKNSDLAFLVKGYSKTTYHPIFKCDIWSANGALHFKTGIAHKEVTKGFSDWKDALDFLSQMISAGVQGYFDIALNTENDLWYIIPAVSHYDKSGKSEK